MNGLGVGMREVSLVNVNHCFQIRVNQYANDGCSIFSAMEASVFSVGREEEYDFVALLADCTYFLVQLLSVHHVHH